MKYLLRCSFSLLFKNAFQSQKVLTAVLIGLLFSLTAVAQQGGTIKGTVRTSDGKPGEFVTISLKGTTRGTAAKADGHYTLSGIKPGTYTLVASFTGLITQAREVTVTAGQSQTINFTLSENNEQLQEVIVKSNHNKFAQRESEYISRLPLKNLENPQVYNTVSSALMKEQVVTDMAQAQSNIPGTLVISAGGGSVGVTTRGFTNFFALRDGMNASNIGPEDPVNVERIEAIKGPVGTLFGNIATSLGGVLNYVSKKPYDDFGGEVSYTTGSYQLNRLTADINTPLNEEKTLLFRVTGAYQTRNGYTNNGGGLWSNTYSISPKLTYKASPRLTLNLTSDIVAQKYDAGFGYTIMPGVTAKSFKDLPLAYDKTLSSNGLYNQNFMNNVTAKADYKISDSWTSQTTYAYSEGHYPNQYLYALAYWLNNTTVRRLVGQWVPDNKFGQLQFQQNFVGDFKIAGLRNRLVAGADWSQYYYNLNRPSSYATGYVDTVDVTKPIPEISELAVNTANAKYPYNYTSNKVNMYSAYASDVLNVTDNLLVMLSLRVSRYIGGGSYNQATGLTTGKYNQTQYSPKLGIVYQLLKDKISLFANYNNGFINVAPAATGPSGAITALKPQQAFQTEGGVKFDLFDGKLSSTLSYYNIKVTNATYPDPSNAAFTIQDGTQRSRGFEADFIANPLPGLNLIAGYGYNENTYTQSSAAMTGKSAVYAPKNIANLWLSYKATAGALKDFGIGAGGNYVSDSWFNTTNTFIVNGYTLLNAAVFYAQPKYTLNVKLNNITSAEYWNAGTSLPQMPRNIAVGISYKFS